MPMDDQEQFETRAYLTHLEGLITARTEQLRAAVRQSEDLMKFVRRIQSMQSLEIIQDEIRAKFGSLEDAEAAARSVPQFFEGKSGDPVPEVDPDDLKTVWAMYREVHERHGQDVAIDISLIAASCKPNANVQATTYRAGQLLFAIHFIPEQYAKAHEQKLLDNAAYEAALGQLLPAELSDRIRQGQLDGGFFRAAAKVSMKWMGTGVIHNGLPFSVDEFMRLYQRRA